MLTQHIALVPEADGLSPAELTRVSAALQKQVTRDLAPTWGVTATVDAFADLRDVPVGYRPIVLTRCELKAQGGVHLDDNGQPFAQVQLGENWSLTASRVCLELLVNPYGTQTVTAPSLRSDQGPVEYLIEICGPTGDAAYAYSVNGVAVCDFCMPAFYLGGVGQRYSFTGAAKAPMEPLPGGHMTWFDPVTGSYWLRSHWGHSAIDSKLGDATAEGMSVREILNACEPLRAPRALRLPAGLQRTAEQAQRASERQAFRLRRLLGHGLEGGPARALTAPPDYQTVNLAELRDSGRPELKPAPPPPPPPQERPRSRPLPPSQQGRSSATPPPLPGPPAVPREHKQPSLSPVTVEGQSVSADTGRGPAIVLLGAAAVVLLGIAIYQAARHDPQPVAGAPSPPAAASAPVVQPSAADSSAEVAAPDPAPAAAASPAVDSAESTKPAQAEPAALSDEAQRAKLEARRRLWRQREARKAEREQAEAAAQPPVPDRPPPPPGAPIAIEDLIGSRQ